MSYETAIAAIQKQIAKHNDNYDIVEIQFMGGEPFLEFNLIKAISEWAWRNKTILPPISLFAQTNGTLVQGEIRDWLYSNKDRFSVALSFDGTTAMQTLNRTASAIDLEFFAHNWPEQNVKMTISPETLNYLSDGVIFLHNQGFKHVAADLAMGEKISWEMSHLSVYQQQLHKLVDYYIEKPDMEPFSQLRLNVFASQSENSISSKTCSCGEDLICIDWNGDEYACHLFAPITATKEKARESKLIDFSQHDKFIFETCKGCALQSACNQCYGMNYICNGDVSIPSTFHCNAFKMRYAANLRLTYEKLKQENQIEAITELSEIIN